MGTYIHRAVIVQMPPDMPGTRWGADYDAKFAALTEFRASLPSDDWRALVVGPVASVINGFRWVIFLPDGSKEWWDTSDEGDGYRERFLSIFPGALIAEWGDTDPSLTVADR